MAEKKKCRVRYSHQVRQQAVRMMAELGYTPRQVAEKFGCTVETARQWRKAYVAGLSQEDAASFEQSQDENKRLRKELTQLRMENEILKKAAAYFARDSM